MLKKHLVALVAGMALLVASIIASVGVADSQVAWNTSAGQAIACGSSGHAGGGC
ncbi:MAG: hypothetical protein H6632_15070 [Anaerolineales bacterium]|nr:hypothetical protein [Anaerolineales bacterium]